MQRISAAYRLGEIRSPLGISELIRALRDKSQSVRHASAVALGKIVAAATRRETTTLEAPISVTVMDEEEVMLRVPETVADAVAYVPSTQFVGEQLNIRGLSGYARGTGSRGLLLMDCLESMNNLKVI